MVYKLWSTNEVLTAADVNAYLMRQTVIKCTSGTRPASPDEGMVIYETDTNQLKAYNGTTWVRTGAFDQETYGWGSALDSTTLSGITSTSAIAGSPVVGFAFKAPPSGGIWVTVGGTVRQSNNGNETRLTYSVRAGAVVGSGAVVVGASSLRAVACGQAVVSSGPSMASASFRHPHTGLTPLADYNVRTEHAVSGGSGGIDYRFCGVEPML